MGTGSVRPPTRLPALTTYLGPTCHLGLIQRFSQPELLKVERQDEPIAPSAAQPLTLHTSPRLTWVNLKFLGPYLDFYD